MNQGLRGNIVSEIGKYWDVIRVCNCVTFWLHGFVQDTYPSKSQFLHLENGDNNTDYFIGFIGTSHRDDPIGSTWYYNYSPRSAGRGISTLSK